MKYSILLMSVAGLVLLACFSGCLNDPIVDDSIIFVNINGGEQYQSIQEAINASSANQTIFVYNGVYYEHLQINKTITLRGEEAERTIIDGGGDGDIISVSESGNLDISFFTIRNSGSNHSYPDYDVAIDLHSNDNILNRLIIRDNDLGIYAAHIRYNNITNSSFLSNTEYGIYFYTDSKYNFISNNTFENNSCGLRIKGSNDNTVTQNVFKDNIKGMYFCCGARNNLAYHNIFINNSQYNGNDFVSGNNWDNDYPSGGNYWDDYGGIDLYNGPDQNITGTDGIGDTPYNVTSDGKRKDNYPLMNPPIFG